MAEPTDNQSRDENKGIKNLRNFKKRQKQKKDAKTKTKEETTFQASENELDSIKIKQTNDDTTNKSSFGTSSMFNSKEDNAPNESFKDAKNKPDLAQEDVNHNNNTISKTEEKSKTKKKRRRKTKAEKEEKTTVDIQGNANSNDVCEENTQKTPPNKFWKNKRKKMEFCSDARQEDIKTEEVSKTEQGTPVSKIIIASKNQNIGQTPNKNKNILGNNKPKSKNNQQINNKTKSVEKPGDDIVRTKNTAKFDKQKANNARNRECDENKKSSEKSGEVGKTSKHSATSIITLKNPVSRDHMTTVSNENNEKFSSEKITTDETQNSNELSNKERISKRPKSCSSTEELKTTKSAKQNKFCKGKSGHIQEDSCNLLIDLSNIQQKMDISNPNQNDFVEKTKKDFQLVMYGVVNKDGRIIINKISQEVTDITAENLVKSSGGDLIPRSTWDESNLFREPPEPPPPPPPSAAKPNERRQVAIPSQPLINKNVQMTLSQENEKHISPQNTLSSALCEKSEGNMKVREPVECQIPKKVRLSLPDATCVRPEDTSPPLGVPATSLSEVKPENANQRLSGNSSKARPVPTKPQRRSRSRTKRTKLSLASQKKHTNNSLRCMAYKQTEEGRLVQHTPSRTPSENKEPLVKLQSQTSSLQNADSSPFSSSAPSISRLSLRNQDLSRVHQTKYSRPKSQSPSDSLLFRTMELNKHVGNTLNCKGVLSVRSRSNSHSSKSRIRSKSRNSRSKSKSPFKSVSHLQKQRVHCSPMGEKEHLALRKNVELPSDKQQEAKLKPQLETESKSLQSLQLCSRSSSSSSESGRCLKPYTKSQSKTKAQNNSQVNPVASCTLKTEPSQVDRYQTSTRKKMRSRSCSKEMSEKLVPSRSKSRSHTPSKQDMQPETPLGHDVFSIKKKNTVATSLDESSSRMQTQTKLPRGSDKLIAHEKSQKRKSNRPRSQPGHEKRSISTSQQVQEAESILSLEDDPWSLSHQFQYHIGKLSLRSRSRPKSKKSSKSRSNPTQQCKQQENPSHVQPRSQSLSKETKPTPDPVSTQSPPTALQSQGTQNSTSASNEPQSQEPHLLTSASDIPDSQVSHHPTSASDEKHSREQEIPLTPMDEPHSQEDPPCETKSQVRQGGRSQSNSSRSFSSSSVYVACNSSKEHEMSEHESETCTQSQFISCSPSCASYQECNSHFDNDSEIDMDLPGNTPIQLLPGQLTPPKTPPCILQKPQLKTTKSSHAALPEPTSPESHEPESLEWRERILSAGQKREYFTLVPFAPGGRKARGETDVARGRISLPPSHALPGPFVSCCGQGPCSLAAQRRRRWGQSSHTNPSGTFVGGMAAFGGGCCGSRTKDVIVYTPNAVGYVEPWALYMTTDAVPTALWPTGPLSEGEVPGAEFVRDGGGGGGGCCCGEKEEKPDKPSLQVIVSGHTLSSLTGDGPTETSGSEGISTNDHREFPNVAVLPTVATARAPSIGPQREPWGWRTLRTIDSWISPRARSLRVPTSRHLQSAPTPHQTEQYREELEERPWSIRTNGGWWQRMKTAIRCVKVKTRTRCSRDKKD